jgi:hypothetical protein
MVDVAHLAAPEAGLAGQLAKDLGDPAWIARMVESLREDLKVMGADSERLGRMLGASFYRRKLAEIESSLRIVEASLNAR